MQANSENILPPGDPSHASLEQLESGLDAVRNAPKDVGVLRWIVRRPDRGQREVLQQAELDPAHGLVGDSWKARGSSKTADGSALADMQITIMSARVIALVAREQPRWQLAGDQLFVDLDLSTDNLPPGTRLRIGSALLEVSAYPHTGCSKFTARFGPDATQFVNSPSGRQLQLRGINARIIQAGTVKLGDTVTRLPARDPD